MGRKIKVLIADKDHKTVQIMRSILSLENKFDIVGVCNNSGSVIKTAQKQRPDIVLLDISMEGIEDMSLTQILTIDNPNILVVVTFNRGEKKNLKKAMSDGAREYIVKPFAFDILTKTIVNLYDKDSNRQILLKSIAKKTEVKKSPKIISVFSTKGGVGKTTIATNLATSLSKKNKNNVVLVDLDLQFGDISIMMNLYPERTISDLSNDIQNLNINILEEYLVTHDSGVKVLPSPKSPELAEFITEAFVEKVLNLLKQYYTYVIVDLPPQFNNISIKALDMSEQILLISTLDLPTIKNIKVGLNIMENLSYDDKKITFILNRHFSNSLISVGDAESSTEKKVKYVIPEDRKTVLKSINSGRPFVLSSKNSSIAKRIKNVSEFIMDENYERKTFLKKILK